MFQAVRPSQVYLDEAAMRANGYTDEQIAQFLLDYTKAQGAPGGPADVPEDERDDRFFAAAIPTSILSDLVCLPEAHG